MKKAAERAKPMLRLDTARKGYSRCGTGEFTGEAMFQVLEQQSGSQVQVAQV